MSLRTVPARAAAWAKEIVYPRTCALCDRRGSWLCDECVMDWVPIVPALCCDRCGHPILARKCGTCRVMNPAIVKARAVAAYDGWPARSLQRFKYDRERDRSGFISEHMMAALQSLGPADILIPVPLHEAKRQDRGFNQAEILANHLSTSAGIPVEHALVRVKQTSSQTKLNRAQRIANMEGAMELAPGWKGDPAKHYVLVDDVYTTGTTMSACADQLTQAGITRTSVLTFMHDIQPRDLERYRRMLIAANL